MEDGGMALAYGISVLYQVHIYVSDVHTAVLKACSYVC